MIFILFIPLFLFSLNLSEILVHPKSYVRDFYLTEFMKETNSTTLAYKAYNSLYRPKPFKHLRILAKKDKKFAEIYRCVNVKKSYFRDVNISCILNNGLSFRTISKLSLKDKKYLYKNLPPSTLKSAIKYLIDKNFDYVYDTYEMGYLFLLHYPNKKEIDEYVKDFSPFYGKYFDRFVKTAIFNDMTTLQISLLLNVNYKNQSDKVKWWLFLNALDLNKEKEALKILKSIKNKKSREYFWLALLTKDTSYTQKLLQFKRVNFYTLWTREKYNLHFNVITKILKEPYSPLKYDQRNPWQVLKFFHRLKRGNLKKLIKELNNPNSMALKALALDKYHKFNINYFITPKMYDDKNASFKAFVYAIARQESRFIPASVSRSYALGTMQMMPFLIRSYKGDVFKQFDYNQNIKLSVKHLKWLFKKLKNPLFVAYAYNGGIGFVKRRVIPKFNRYNKYEPFLSMELVPYDESREYGKKVITNFIIYSKIFNRPLKLRDILKP